MSKKTVCYLRVKNVKKGQDYTKTKSFIKQIEILRNYCGRKGFELVDNCFCTEIDEGATHSTDSEIVEDLLYIAISSHPDIILFSKIEEFSSNPLFILDFIIKLKRFGVDFECVSGELGTLTFLERSNLFSYLALMEFRKGLLNRPNDKNENIV